MKFTTSSKIALLAAAALTGAALPSFAQDADFLAKYRAQGGLLPIQAGDPPAGQNGKAAGPSSEGPARAMQSPLYDGNEMSPERIDGFNEAIQQAFPMTPEMIRRYREIQEANERAVQERSEPAAKISTTIVSLEPGEAPPLLKVSPSIASVLSFYDASGAPWPVDKFILGDHQTFNSISMGDDSNSLALTPLARIGFTNIVVQLREQTKPVILRVNIDESTVDDRFDVQVMHLGPNATTEQMGASRRTVTEAGSSALLAVITGVDLPKGAKPVRVAGVDARGWLIGEDLYLRSRHALLSPLGPNPESMSGPDGMRAYKVDPVNFALFSVNGQIVRADIQLP